MMLRPFSRPAQLPTRRRTRGFTLIEIMVVVVIIGLLATLVAPMIYDRLEQARVTTTRTNITALMNNLQMYKLDNLRYPTQEQGLAALAAKPQVDPLPANWRQIIKKVPKDGWDNDFQYANPGTHGEVDVFSYGADGQPGGEGDDADIGSWE